MNACSVDDCGNQARRSGLCWTHLWRRRKHKSMCEPVRHYGLRPLALLQSAMDRYRDAEEDDEYRRARYLVWKHASLYRKGRGLKISTPGETL